jgi:hypothetical protein
VFVQRTTLIKRNQIPDHDLKPDFDSAKKIRDLRFEFEERRIDE